MQKVGNQILVKGDVVKPPNSTRKWIVTKTGDKVELVCTGKKITKKDLDLSEWLKINE